MSLSKLNHDCFLSVLRSCSLLKQLHLRLVCTSWCTYLESAFHHRRSLALLEAPSSLFLNPYKRIPTNAFYFTPNPLLIPPSSAHLAFPLLVRLFPSVRKLLLFTATIPCRHRDVYVNAISGSLTTLAITSAEQIDWITLSQAPNLKRLYSYTFFLPPWLLDVSQPEVLKVFDLLEAFASEEATGNTLHYLGAALGYLKIGSLRFTVHNTEAGEADQFEETLYWLKSSPARESLQFLEIDNIYSSLYWEAGYQRVIILHALCRVFKNLKKCYIFNEKVGRFTFTRLLHVF